MLTGKPGYFAVGADISQFSARSTPEAAREGSRAGHTLLRPASSAAVRDGRRRQRRVPRRRPRARPALRRRTVAAGVRHAGFPECFLGLIPGWGGTQLLPRLAGARTAVKVIVENAMRQNRMLDAGRLLELGIVDRLLDPEALLEESVAWARELAGSGPPRAGDPFPDRDEAAEIVAKARRSLDETVHGTAPAPYKALDLIEGAAHWTYEEGIQAEQDAFAELLPGDEAQASIYAFQLVEFRQKKLPGIPKVEPRAVGEGRHRRRRPDGDPARAALSEAARGADRDPRHRLGPGRRGARHAARDGRQAGARRPRLRHDGLGGIRGLRPRARSGLRGAHRQARGPRCSRERRPPGLHPRHQHLGALGRRRWAAGCSIRNGSSACTSSTPSR